MTTPTPDRDISPRCEPASRMGTHRGGAPHNALCKCTLPVEYSTDRSVRTMCTAERVVTVVPSAIVWMGMSDLFDARAMVIGALDALRRRTADTLHCKVLTRPSHPRISGAACAVRGARCGPSPSEHGPWGRSVGHGTSLRILTAAQYRSLLCARGATAYPAANFRIRGWHKTLPPIPQSLGVLSARRCSFCRATSFCLACGRRRVSGSMHNICRLHLPILRPFAIDAYLHAGSASHHSHLRIPFLVCSSALYEVEVLFKMSL
ncbi:hypothetical protein HYPSUDRAFT_288573 [Hypholoma sublateritium FD-334 SS-4]|uniref:Uncharacterized protein n=1 Tax=Hypholoma sublateritium (strain FD-334 SS-4) TaxID=945553 RepID=A0A0D2M002_HYPSF|nr:hypothetical protein HYPSUDRAFT_288573 [Hypholoma sublateritium FD-334 SS-4]